MIRTKIFTCLCSAVFAFVAFHTGLQAESQLCFPRLSAEAGTITGIAIVNPREEEAALVITAYGEDGSVITGAGIQNPVETVVGAGKQLALLTSNLFGPSLPESTVGWFLATSETNDLTGFFMFLDLEMTIFDGADLPSQAEKILFTDVRIQDSLGTEINLVNPGGIEAQLDLELFNAEGASVASPLQIVIPPLGVRREQVEDLFAVAEELKGSVSYLLVTSNTDVAGFELVGGDSDVLGLNAQTLDEPVNRLFFPQMAVLGDLSSRISLASSSQQPVIVTLTAHKPDGSLYDAADLQTNPVNRVIDPGGSLSMELEDLFGFSGPNTLDGWLEVEGSSESLFGSLSYVVLSNGSTASVIGTAQGSTRALFSHLATDLGFFTGLALLNSGALAATFQIVALRPDGSELGSFSSVLRPGERTSMLVPQFVPAADGQAGGFIWIKSDVPLYLTSIFGSPESGVFSNIPPQPVPDSFDPLASDEDPRLRPILAVLEPAGSQTFQVEGLEQPLIWKVNGLEGGDALTGSIDETGKYLAPAIIPDDQPITVTAFSEQQAAGASVDVLSIEEFRTDLGSLQAVAYLGGLQRLFTAELAASGLPASGGLQGSLSSTILDVTESGAGQILTQLAGEEVGKMIAFTAVDGREYLLVSITNTGTVLRLDPEDGALLTVASGLDQPTALALDKINDALLVAEATQVTSIESSELNAGLGPAGSAPAGGVPKQRKKLFDAAGSRIAVDGCSGNVFVSLPAKGEIVEFVRFTGGFRTVADELANPGGLLGFYRRAVSCPDAFHLLFPERDADRLTLLIPSAQELHPWIDASGVVDVAFLAVGNPFAPGGGIVLARDNGKLSLTRFPRVYWDSGLNPPKKFFPSPCRLDQLTLSESGQNGPSFLTEDESRVLFVATTDPLGSNADGNQELFEIDLDTRVLTQLTETSAGDSTRPVANFNGTVVAFLSTADLTGESPPGQNLFVLSSSGFERVPGEPDPAESYSIDLAGIRLVYASSADLTGENPDGNTEIFLYNATQTVRQISVTEGGHNGGAAISGDGKWIAFSSTADIGGLNPDLDQVLYLHERESGITSLVAIMRADPQEFAPLRVLLDADASHVIFNSFLDLTGDNPGEDRALFLFRRNEQVFEQLGTALGLSDISDISFSGDLVAIASNKNLVKLNKDTNREVFLLDVEQSRVYQITRSRDFANLGPTVGGSGEMLVFRSQADYNLQNPDGNAEIYLAECSLDE